MSKTEPIRNREELELLKNYFIVEKPNVRNHVLITLGLNTMLRISDLLNLKWKDVLDFDRKCFRTHIEICEQKTGKHQKCAINQSALDALKMLLESIKKPEPCMYLFAGKGGGNNHLSRSQAYRLIREAAKANNISGNISCHSLRKTFGYYAWKNGTEPALLMEIYNHSAYSITKHYLCIDQNEKDAVFFELNL